MRSSRIDLTGERDFLTKAEMLFLKRRRLGLSQKDMAETMGTSRHKYAAVELGADRIPVVKFAGHLTPQEKCVIYRRRSGQTQAETARDMDCSRVWLNRMENGEVDCTALLCHWEA